MVNMKGVFNPLRPIVAYTLQIIMFSLERHNSVMVYARKMRVISS
jgi:hypothetical protein